MRIVGIIDSLGSGGAQRQFTYLMKFLKLNGYDVRVLVYHKYDFFKPLLRNIGVLIEEVENSSPLNRIWNMRKAIYRHKPDVVITFLETPGLIAELATLPARKFRLIVSERNYDINGLDFYNLQRFLFHSLADKVVTNSYSQAEFIKKAAPWLRKKVFTIVNCVDLDKFCPSERKSDSNLITVIASFIPRKNPHTLLQGLRIASNRSLKNRFHIEWYGAHLTNEDVSPYLKKYFTDVMADIRNHGFEKLFRWYPPRHNVIPLYQKADAVCLASFYEGCPNAICEAMACGRPILASNVSDIPRMVEDGVNGFLFDPGVPESIADALLKFSNLSKKERAKMGQMNREKAEKIFSSQYFLESYEKLWAT